MKAFISTVRSRYRYSVILLNRLVITDFKLRYQASILGYLWSLLRPLSVFVIMYAVFVKFLHVDFGVKASAVYLLSGIVLWNYFSEVTNGGVGSVVGKGDLIRKLNFPKYVIVLAGSFSALINLFINFLVIALFAVINHAEPTPLLLIGVPLLVLQLFILALSVAFFLSALFVRLRDVNYIWEVLMQAAFYATPIFYPVTALPKRLSIDKIIMTNPVAQIIQDFRYLLVSRDVKTIGDIYGTQWARAIPVAITVVVCIFAASYFRRHSKRFAEDL